MDKKKKIMAGAGAAVIILAGAAFFLTGKGRKNLLPMYTVPFIIKESSFWKLPQELERQLPLFIRQFRQWEREWERSFFI